MLDNITAEILVEIGSKHDIVIDVIGPQGGKYAAHLRDLSNNSIFFTTEYDFDSSKHALSIMTELIRYAENYLTENSGTVVEGPHIISVAEAIQHQLNEDNKRR